MVGVIEDHRIAFFGIHKSATTSVKMALYEIVHGTPWEGDMRVLHPMFPSVPVFPETFRKYRDYWTFTVIRDPVKRFLSAYQNRVHDFNDLTDALRKGRVHDMMRRLFPGWRPVPFRGFELHPPIESFIADYDRYAGSCAGIHIHTCPASVFIGHDLGYFDAVYTTADLPRLERDLSDRIGRPISFGRANEAGSPPPRFADLSARAQAWLLEHTRSDYALFRDHFKAPSLAQV